MKQMHNFWGKVKSGKSRGKALGFPTANISLHRKIPEGIYLSLIKISGKQYPALTFVGVAETFGETEFLSESYLLDFNQNLYHKWVSVSLLKKIRENQKFKSEKELIEQMNKDKQQAIKSFTLGIDTSI